MTTNESNLHQAVRSALIDIVDEAPMAPEWNDLTHQTQHLTSVPVPGRRFRSPTVALAATASLVLLVLGGATLILRGDVPQVVGGPGTTIAVSPEVTVATGSPSPTTDIPPVTIAPVLLPYDEVLDGSAAALFASMTLASDGSPVIASFVSDVMTFDVWSGAEESTISAIRLVRCLDTQCAESPVIVDMAEVGWQGAPQLAVDPFDRPVIGSESEEGPVIAFCDDPGCSSFETRQVDEARIWGIRDWAFAPDGNPVYLSLISDRPHRLDLVACLDRFCDATTSTSIDSGFFIHSLRSPRVASDGSVLLVYATEEPIGPPDPETGYDGDDFFSTQKVAWCVDAACSGGPVITTIDEGINVGGGELLDGAAGIDVIRYIAQSEPRGPEDHRRAINDVTYGDATCLNKACTEFELTYLGPYELGDGTSSLPVGLPTTLAPDGSLFELRNNEAGLILVRLSATEGGTWSFTTLATFDPADSGFEWGYGDLVIGRDGLPIVVYGDDAGLHLIRCPDLACTPPNGG